MKLSKFSRNIIAGVVFFVMAVVAVGTLQYIMLAPHLRYGFADVDWVFLYRYNNLPAFSLNQIIGEWQASGVYAYQTYYIGIQEIFYGRDYEKFHLTTNIFRFLSVATLYPVIFYLSKNKLLALVTTIIYGVSYTAIGAMYTVVTSGIYISVTVLNLFLWLYIYCIRNNSSWRWIVILFILFFSAMFLSTERLYPIFPLLILVELFLVWRSGFKKTDIMNSAKRLLLVAIPLCIALLYRPYASTNVQFLGNTRLLADKIIIGNWQLLLTPFVSLGGLFVPREYWNYFGVVNDVSFTKYLRLYMVNFGITSVIVTLLLAFVSSTRPLLFTVKTLAITFCLALISFLAINHRLLIPETIRMHFDPQIYFIPALIGQYIFALGFAYFEEWRVQKYQNILLFCAFFGIFSAFVFIFLTWLPAEPGLLFTSVHRYLTVPGIGMSLFVGAIITMAYYRLRRIKYINYLAVIVFLLIVPIIIINDQVTRNYFKYEIEFAGTNGAEHNRMKSKLWSYLGNMDTSKPALFYFDESQGKEDGYFHETSLLAGFNFWMMLWNGDAKNTAMPELMRSSLLCQAEPSPCLEEVGKYIQTQDNQKGIVFNKQFFSPEDIYAFRLVDRDVVDIRHEFFEKLDLEFPENR